MKLLSVLWRRENKIYMTTDYVKRVYIRGMHGRNGRQLVATRLPPEPCNVCQAELDGKCRTDSERLVW